ncbi:MAG: alpha/beta hydrolase, partial [Nanoarchaeota archaeon]
MNKLKNFYNGLILCFGALLAGCASHKYINMLERIIKEEHSVVRVNEEYEGMYANYYASIQGSMIEKKKIELSKNRFVNLEIYRGGNTSSIILLPTLGEPVSSLEKFSKEMASYGHHVYALDIEGFGESSGERGEIIIEKIEEDISETIEYVKSQNCKRLILAGTSIGGEFSLLYGAEGRYKNDIDGFIIHGVFAPSLNKHIDYRENFCENSL